MLKESRKQKLVSKHHRDHVTEGTEKYLCSVVVPGPRTDDDGRYYVDDCLCIAG